jgi:two-component system sensor histidine kinase KdpD
VHVSSASQEPTPEEQSGLRDNLELAEDLGAEILTLKDGDAATALTRLAKERHITQIVIGKSQRSKWQQLFRPSMSGKLLGMVTQDVHVVSAQVPGTRDQAQARKFGGGE